MSVWLQHFFCLLFLSLILFVFWGGWTIKAQLHIYDRSSAPTWRIKVKSIYLMLNFLWFFSSPLCAFLSICLVVSERKSLLVSLVLFWLYASCTAWASAWSLPSPLFSVPSLRLFFSYFLLSLVCLKCSPEFCCPLCLPWSTMASLLPICLSLPQHSSCFLFCPHHLWFLL